MSLSSEFDAKCGSLPINMSILFAACTLDSDGHRPLHSHYQIRQNLSRRTITKFESSPTPDGAPGPETQTSCQPVHRKLLELDYLLSEGLQEDLFRQGIVDHREAASLECARREAYVNCAPCSSCGAALPLDALQIAYPPAEAGDGHEAILTVFRACGLTEGLPGLEGGDAMNSTGELIYSFFCYLHGGPQILEERCRHRTLRYELRCIDCVTGSYSNGANVEAASCIW